MRHTGPGVKAEAVNGKDGIMHFKSGKMTHAETETRECGSTRICPTGRVEARRYAALRRQGTGHLSAHGLDRRCGFRRKRAPANRKTSGDKSTPKLGE